MTKWKGWKNDFNVRIEAGLNERHESQWSNEICCERWRKEWQKKLNENVLKWLDKKGGKWI